MYNIYNKLEYLNGIVGHLVTLIKNENYMRVCRHLLSPLIEIYVNFKNVVRSDAVRIAHHGQHCLRPKLTDIIANYW